MFNLMVYILAYGVKSILRIELSTLDFGGRILPSLSEFRSIFKNKVFANYKSVVNTRHFKVAVFGHNPYSGTFHCDMIVISRRLISHMHKQDNRLFDLGRRPYFFDIKHRPLLVYVIIEILISQLGLWQ